MIKSIKAKSPKTPKALKALISLLSISVIANAGVPVARTVDVSATIKPVHLETYAGETLDLSVQLASGGSPLATPSASATIYWQTNGMANAWWQTNMSCSASGLVTGSWSPGLPSGRVWFFVGVESSGLNYRIAGQCAILPSPGGAPSTAVLPPPGGTLNLGDYTIIGAPWITSSDSAAAITSAISPLSRDISALSERADAAATAGSNYTDSVAAPLIAATNSITARLDSIVIPDVSGFASKTSLQSASNSLADAVQQSSNALAQATSALAQTVSDNAQQSSSVLISATNALHTSFAPTVSAASTALQPAASNALAQATAALAQTVSDNAQQSGYDLAAASNALAQATAALAQTVADNAQQSGYDLAAASNALAQATAALAQTVSDNAQQSGYDLAAASNALAQATAALAQTVADNAQQATSDLVSATNGIPEEIISSTNALNQSLAPTISSTSNALAQATSALAQKVDGLAITTATSNTAYRLMSLDGQIYQDATGTVWQSSTAIGTSQWYFVAITYTNGTTIATNEIPGISSWSIDGEWYGGDVGAEEWRWTLRVPAGGSEYSTVVGGEDASPSDMSLSFTLVSGDISGLSFARTNTVSHYWSPVDHVLYASSGGGGGGLTTNDVCNIVTNEARIVSAWTIEGLQPGDTYQFWDDGPGYYGWSWGFIVTDKDGNVYYSGTGYTTEGPDDATKVVFGGGLFVATRTIEIKNALGFARLVDLPPLTNDLPTQISSVVQDVAVPRVNNLGFGQVWWDADGMFNIASLGIWFNDTFIVTEDDVELSSGNISFAATNFTYNGSPVATYQSIATAADAGTNYTDSAIAAVDTSYPRVIGITNINQTVQYVSIDSAVPTTLSIMLPTSGDTKDWIVYVTSQTNVTISLPAATWWLADTSATNDIAPQTPTALYFSQAADGIYTLGRQEFTEVVLP